MCMEYVKHNRYYVVIIAQWYQWQKDDSMPDLVLERLSDQLHRDLKSAARRNHRSLNSEIIARLTESFHNEAVDTERLLERIRLRRQTIGPVDLSEETLREMRDAGRP